MVTLLAVSNIGFRGTGEPFGNMRKFLYASEQQDEWNPQDDGQTMKVATGRDIYLDYGAAALEIVPDLRWALFEQDGSWSESPDDCELIVLAGDCYSTEFKQQTAELSAPLWAHTEDAGTDGPFYEAMRDKNVMVTHSPGSNATEVAEFAMSLLLWKAKRLDELRDQQSRGVWKQLELEGLSDKTVLVVGLGAIGSRIARMSKGFGMRVLGIRHSVEPVEYVDEQGNADDLTVFLPKADFVILALPLTPLTNGLINRHSFSKMKPGATLINVARGDIVDIPALLESLDSGLLGQACLDVVPTEPLPREHDLWATPGLFLTPHNASQTPLYTPRVMALWLQNLKRYINNEPLLGRLF